MNSGNNTPKKPENRPGLPKIAYRISDYAGFRRWLLSLLPSILRPNKSEAGALAKLTTRLDDDPAIALLDAWAVVGEVLTFYQERIANEGYLRTATERRSVLELARAIGYELKPGVAASTFLTFTVEDAPLSPRVATIPKGTQIMSIPNKDELPQTFETIAEFTAHVDWNVIKPRPSRPQIITNNTRQLYLNGISTQLKAGDYLLLVDEDREIHTYLLPLTDVKEDAQAGYTLVEWDEYLAIDHPQKTPLRNPKVFAFRQKANLFGYNAPAWEDMTAEVKLAAIEAKGGSIQGGVFSYSDNDKKWNSVSKGLPNADILCLTIWDGMIFAGTAGKGIFCSKDHGKNWEPVNNGLTNFNIQTLYTNLENPRNPLFAGTSGGGVFRSKDGGKNWVLINTGNVRVEGANGTSWYAVNTSLLTTIVRSILTYTSEEVDTNKATIKSNLILDNTQASQELKIIHNIFIGTDDGIYRSQTQGNDWININLTNKTVYSLLYKENNLFAGTDRGLYCSLDHGENWENIQFQNKALSVFALTSFNNLIFAGTDAGVFYLSYSSEQKPNNWKALNIIQDNPDYTLAKYKIRSLATYPEDENHYYIFAATEDGIYRTTDADNDFQWVLLSRSLSTQDITTVVCNEQKTLFAGSKFSEFLPTTKKQEWSDFKLPDNQIDLDTIYPQILSDSWIVLLDKNNYINNQISVAVSQAKSTSTITRKDFGLNTKITRIEPDQVLENAKIFRLRSTIVLVRSEELELAKELLTVNNCQQEIFQDPIQNETILLKDFIQGLQTNQTLIVNGKRIGIQLDDVGGIFQPINVIKADLLSLIKDLKFEKNNQGLINSQVTALTYGSQKIITGTTEGIFYSTDNGKYWEPIVGWSQFNQQLKKKDIQAILNFEQHERRNLIFVGTAEGIFRSQDSGETWKKINLSLTYTDIRAIALYNDKLLIGTINGGVFQSENNGESWTPTSLNNTDVQAIEIQQNPSYIFAGTIRDGIFYSKNGGNTWHTINTGLTNLNITALATLATGAVFAGTSGSGVFRSKNHGDRWEQININLTDLEIRCLTVDANENIWLGTASGGVFYSDNQGELWQPVNTNLTNIDVRAILIPDNYTVFVGGVGIIQSVDGFESKPVQRRDVLQLLEPPILVPNAPANYQQWKLMDKDGFQGYLTTISSEEITLLPAATDSEVVSEVVKIQSPPTDQQMPVLTLQEPLKNAYDPTTVKIYGNVVQATHGETIEEVLGSGDGNLINQRFAIKKPPLTYIPTTTASGASSTLEMRVNGILWQEVSSFYPLTAQDQSYIIRIEDDGTTSVTFGDGIQGSRLPTGEENITATYRSGIGLDGNVGVDRLSLLKTRPLGIIEVTNPIPATGAAAPESLEEARLAAPSTVRTLDRIVSLQDFEDFVRGFAGIGKAQAVELWHEETQLVHITIASAKGAEVLQESNLYTNLIAAIDLARDPLQKVQVDSYDRLLFNLEARLLLDPRYQTEAIKDKVIAALNSTFTFERRQFGQAVTASEVVAVIQNIAGIVAVDLDALYQARRSKTLEQSLTALQALCDPQTDLVNPAQLLLLNPAGIKLTIVNTF